MTPAAPDPANASGRAGRPIRSTNAPRTPRGDDANASGRAGRRIRSTNAPRTPRGWLIAALAAYAVAGAVLTLVPDNPFSFGGREWPLDTPVNLVMFAPPATVALLVWRRLHPTVPVALAALASAGIETLQALSPRDASLRDLVLNVAGAAAGAVVGVITRRRR